MADVPVFLFNKSRSNKLKSAFMSTTKEDILATYKFLYTRNMWSKYHYDRWTAEIKECDSEEFLHLIWDAIVGGAMFEMESPKMEMLEARTEAMEEMAEEKVKAKHQPKNKMMD